ncbi:uncharacterized protein LOC118331713 [Morone saxatilis]|uniref:uncharacterized protein LOC118331713 n=1 Tax=Morone saxatilis TaxID=34816 RepID=UPI0015E1FBA6|nr:uncharacterized protein LOC118331713 [Morone saxatilis]
MRVLRRRAAAMSRREKHLALLSALGFLSVALYYVPTFLYAAVILAVCCVVCYYHSGEPLPARLGLNPRARFNVPAALRRWLRGRRVAGGSVAAAAPRRTTKSGGSKTEHRETEGHFRERFPETGIYRRETLTSDSFLFSPRDFLMGSYIGKPESPAADSGRPRAARNPREQLRERLSRPNHAVYTPNRRLSFTGEPLRGPRQGSPITPPAVYPLQHRGVLSGSPVPSVDGFRKKTSSAPDNSPAALSPVTVEDRRTRHHSTPVRTHLSCAGLPQGPGTPLLQRKVSPRLFEGKVRKREVEDEDEAHS